MLEKLSKAGYCAALVGEAEVLGESERYGELRRHTESALYKLSNCLTLLTAIYFNALYKQGRFEEALEYDKLREKLLCLFDSRGEALSTAEKMTAAVQEAGVLRQLGRREACFQALTAFAETAKTAGRIPDTGHEIPALNGFFETFSETESHMRAADVKGFASAMLEKYRAYFEGDGRFEELKKEFDDSRAE